MFVRGGVGGVGGGGGAVVAVNLWCPVRISVFSTQSSVQSTCVGLETQMFVLHRGHPGF